MAATGACGGLQLPAAPQARAAHLQPPSAVTRAAAAAAVHHRSRACSHASRSRALRLACSSSSGKGNGSSSSGAPGQQASPLAAQLNVACNEALQVMLANDKSRVPAAVERLQALCLDALNAEDLEAARLLSVVEGLLHHTVIQDADELRGPYAAALNRLVNQVAGSDWKLALEGQSPEAAAAAQEPRFSTWDDVINKRKPGTSGGTGSSSNGGSGGKGGGGGVADRTYYDLLGVAPTASAAELKAAYRALALKLHPDVNDAPDAEQRFAEVASAYDALSDPDSRRLYDQFGPEGMKGRSGAGGGSGNASRAWDEFKPYKRENKRTRARDASSASYSSVDEGSGEAAAAAQQQAAPAGSLDGATESAAEAGTSGGSTGGAADPWAGMPTAGMVVEYPLASHVMQELQDGRTHGVGVLIGRNCDRGDAKRLPPEALSLCEVEPLRQEESGSERWVPDDLGVSAFPRLEELRPVPVDSFDRRFDVWVISAPLSEGCGGPELPEEIMI